MDGTLIFSVPFYLLSTFMERKQVNTRKTSHAAGGNFNAFCVHGRRK